MKTTFALSVIGALLATTASLSAETLRWARAGDALTLDPHAQNEGPTHTIRHQMYEPLIIRDVTGEFEAALATDWAPKEDDPNVWVFNLRQGVKFHDGADFTAEDVVFTFETLLDPELASPLRSSFVVGGAAVRVTATGSHTVRFEMGGPRAAAVRLLDGVAILPSHGVRSLVHRPAKPPSDGPR